MSISIATLEWHYRPANLLKEAQTLTAYGASLVIQDGTARAQIDATTFRANVDLADKLLRIIITRLAPYGRESSEALNVDPHPVLSIMHPDDGVREIHLEGTARIQMFSSLDVQIYRNGVLIEDTARTRAGRLQAEAELLSKHADDDLLNRLLMSHNKSTRDPEKEFTHLYEILEALQTRFVKRTKLVEALAIDKSSFSQFHRICNDPSTVSRHRGLAEGPLKEPGAQEFDFARDFAWRLILSYAQYLANYKPNPEAIAAYNERVQDGNMFGNGLTEF
ncbi:hypothetical protein [Pseudomonas savastanoi]|uniref:hypothetical protein n=1 Tax=Pseudomonas savastanoi TaxID=29438 RepID=UPI000F001DBC|nr:hypothetical protein [Pseudomonas savastanoi]